MQLRQCFYRVATVSAYCGFHLPFLWVHNNGPGSVLVAFQHHSHWSPIQACHIDHICGFTSPINVAAVDVNAQVIGLYVQVLIWNWACHNCEALGRRKEVGSRKQEGRKLEVHILHNAETFGNKCAFKTTRRIRSPSHPLLQVLTQKQQHFAILCCSHTGGPPHSSPPSDIIGLKCASLTFCL